MTADDEARLAANPAPHLSHADTAAPPWPWKPWAAPVMLLAIYWMWWEAGARALTRVPADQVPPAAMRVGLAIALGSKVLSHALEAGWYVMLWRGRGVRLGIPWLFTWNATLSLFDLASLWTASAAARAHGVPLALAAVLAGPIALGDASPLAGAGIRAAFGGAGLLAALRIAGLSYTLGRAKGRGMAGSLVMVGASWLASRVALAWITELLHGRSPMP